AGFGAMQVLLIFQLDGDNDQAPETHPTLGNDELNLEGRFWGFVGALNDNFGSPGADLSAPASADPPDQTLRCSSQLRLRRNGSDLAHGQAVALATQTRSQVPLLKNNRLVNPPAERPGC